MARTTYLPGTGSLAGVEVLVSRPTSTNAAFDWVAIFHGLSGSAEGSKQGGTWGGIIQYLADAGYGIIACDMPNWPSATSRTRIDNLWTYFQTLPDKTSTWNVLATSDGSGQFLDWLPQTGNAAKCRRAWLCNPLTDPRWAYGLSGYTPAYSTGGVTPVGSWAADMDAQFAGNWATNSAGYRINDNAAAYRSLGVKVQLAQASDDATLPPAAASWFASQVNDSLVTVRSPASTGGHGNQGSYDPKEVEAFYRW